MNSERASEDEFTVYLGPDSQELPSLLQVNFRTEFPIRSRCFFKEIMPSLKVKISNNPSCVLTVYSLRLS